MKKFILAAVLGIFAYPAYATTDCRPIPSCEGFGYVFSAEDCRGVSVMKCPFDTSKLFCTPSVAPNCTNTQIYDSTSKTCMEGSEYCAKKSQIFDSSTGGCSSCKRNSSFDSASKTCKCNSGYISDGTNCTDGKEYCATTSQVFNDETLSCEDCAATEVYHNKQCLNIIEYCALSSKAYNPETNDCESCPTGTTFDTASNLCKDACEMNSYYSAIPEGNICKVAMAGGKTCYTNCQKSVCGTGSVTDTLAKDTSGNSIAILHNDKYYKPEIFYHGGVTYSAFQTVFAENPEYVMPTASLTTAINSFNLEGGVTSYWTNTTCGSNDLHYDGANKCQYKDYNNTIALGLKDCTDTCPYNAKNSECDPTKYICEKEECSGKYSIKGCNTSYYDKTSSGTSYTCPTGKVAETCRYQATKYACVDCASQNYGPKELNVNLLVSLSPGVTWSSANLSVTRTYTVYVSFYNSCGEYVSSATYSTTLSSEMSAQTSINQTIAFNKPIPTGKYKVYIEDNISGGTVAGEVSIKYGYSSISNEGIFIMGEGYDHIPYDGVEVEVRDGSTPTVQLFGYIEMPR